MKYDLHSPCTDCPFLREGGIRLMPGRVQEIGGLMLSGGWGEFPCHRTTVTDEDDDCDERVTADSQHCAGALIFAENNSTATQMMRISERVRMYHPRKLKGHDRVFADLDEMMETALPIRLARPRQARKRATKGPATRGGSKIKPAKAQGPHKRRGR